ncbi:MAG: hypothetical protein GYA17_20335, partial [Chloroflexi bacterium]|nr:hypothetical protein [Chloroflexota bacterium]
KLPLAMLAYYDENLELSVEPGLFEVMLGSSSADIRLVGNFSVEGRERIKAPRRVYSCPVEIH